MSVTLVCTACGTRLGSDWIQSLGRGQSLVCPHCSSPLIETGYVEVAEDGTKTGCPDGGREAA